MAAAEVAPFARSGGLGEAVSALARALARRGVEVSVVMPGYRCALQSGAQFEHTGWQVKVPVSSRQESAEVLRTRLGESTTVYVLVAHQYFDRPELYGEGNTPYPDNAERFVFFCRAALSLADFVGAPQIVHVHDWHAALVPVFLRADGQRYWWAKACRSVLTIHNLAYQGDFWAEDWHLLNLDARYFSFDALEAWGRINFLKGGISFADAITTVSPTYAQEIQTPEFGCGLDAALRYRSDRLRGILNGVDYEVWNPASDPFLPARYDVEDRRGKRICKQALEQAFALPAAPDQPLAGVVSRLVEQKGMDLLAESLPELAAVGLRIVILGRGAPDLEERLRQRQAEFPGQVGVRIAFDEPLSHLIEGGADLFFMPSRFEPCGLNQMYSLRYGTIPVVHDTGGLHDTVLDADEQPGEGTGFRFRPFQREAFLGAVKRALAAFRDRQRWDELVTRAMRQDFSWDRSAAQYQQLYESLLR